MQILNKNTLATNIFNQLLNNEVYISYYGTLDFSITNELINNVVDRLKKDSISQKVFKDIYIVFAEAIENAYKHQRRVKEDHLGIVFLNKHKNKYHISIGNIIEKKDRVVLSNKLNLLLNLSKDELKGRIREQIAKAHPSIDDSASIGLIKMILHSSSISFSFKELESDELLFIINTNIDIYE